MGLVSDISVGGEERGTSSFLAINPVTKWMASGSWSGLTTLLETFLSKVGCRSESPLGSFSVNDNLPPVRQA